MKLNLEKFVTRRYALLFNNIILITIQEKERFTNLTSIPEFTKNMDIIDGDFYFDTDWMNQITEKYKKANLKIFWNFIKKGYVYGERSKKYARGLNVNKITDLEEVFWESVEILKNLIVFLPVTHPLAEAIELNVLEILKKKDILDSSLADALMEVSSPDKLNTPLLELKDLEKIKKKLSQEKNFDLKRAIKEHVKKYDYLGYREPFSRGYSTIFFMRRLKGLKIKKHTATRYRLKFNPKELRYVKLMKEFVYFRNYRTEKLHEALYYLEPLWKKIARKYKLRPTDFSYYLLSEVKLLFDKNKKLKKSVIDERKRGHGFLMHGRKIKFVTGNTLRVEKKKLDRSEEKVKLLSGASACKGKISGAVKIVLKANEQKKVKEGDILVASMTTPDFVPAMERAAAFITDEGGITCHAAIVSREMNKPCIIGTRVATKVLKDGDLVEVDANKGTVRIIKRK